MEHVYSFVLEIRIAGANGSSAAFIKRYKVAAGASSTRVREMVLTEFEALQNKWNAMAASPEFRVVRPIACFPDDLTVVTEKAPGKGLPEILNAPVLWRWSAKQGQLIDIFERVGAWLRVFQSTGAQSGEFSMAEMRNYVEVRLERLTQARAVSRRFCSELLSHFDAAASEVDIRERAEVPIHVDFSPNNVFASNEAITVIDIPALRNGSRYYDLAHMFVHLENLKIRPWIGPHLVEQLQAAMLRAYDPALTSRRPLFQMELMRNVVSRLLQHNEHAGALQRLYGLLMWRNTRWSAGIWY